ncbi:MAG: DUF4329 domain-containing protein, partial [Gammaproteobacteria bacterium]
AGARGIQRQPATASDETVKAEGERDKILAAAERARKDRGSATTMTIRAAEIVYRMIALFMPDYSDRISGVGFDAGVARLRVDARRGSFSVAVGEQFVMSLEANTLEAHALELGSAILRQLPRAKRGRGLVESVRQAQRALEDGEPPTPDALDAVAITGLERAYCATQKSRAPGWEYCGLIVETAKDTYEATGPVTSRRNDVCGASAPADRKVVGYYHTHPANQGDNFSREDRDAAEARRWTYFLINSKAGMTRYTPEGPPYHAGKVKTLGISSVRC